MCMPSLTFVERRRSTAFVARTRVHAGDSLRSPQRRRDHDYPSATTQSWSLILKERNYGVRINFDPEASDITSIKNRLTTICGRAGLTSNRRHDHDDQRAAREWLLRALVHWNPTAFADIPGALMLSPELVPGKEVESPTIHFNSCLRWLGMKLMRFDVITAEQGEEVVEYLMGEIRAHILEVVTTGKRLPSGAQAIVDDLQGKGIRDKFTNRWSLTRVDHPLYGFASKLLGCFDRKNLTLVEYEDLLEQHFYSLRQAAERTKLPNLEAGDYFELGKDLDEDK